MAHPPSALHKGKGEPKHVMPRTAATHAPGLGGAATSHAALRAGGGRLSQAAAGELPVLRPAARKGHILIFGPMREGCWPSRRWTRGFHRPRSRPVVRSTTSTASREMAGILGH